MHTKQRHSADLEEEIRHARRGQAFEVRDLYWINYSQLPLTISNGRGIQPSNGQRYLKIQSRSWFVSYLEFLYPSTIPVMLQDFTISSLQMEISPFSINVLVWCGQWDSILVEFFALWRSKLLWNSKAEWNGTDFWAPIAHSKHWRPRGYHGLESWECSKQNFHCLHMKH